MALGINNGDGLWSSIGKVGVHVECVNRSATIYSFDITLEQRPDSICAILPSPLDHAI